MLFNVILNELKKEFYSAWSYKWQWFGEFISLIIFFFFLKTLTTHSSSVLGYGLWFYSILIMGDVSNKISQEMRLGTLEQIYLSSLPIPLIFFAKVVTSIFRALIITSILLIIMCLFCDYQLNINYLIIPTILLITPGLLGLSFLVGAFTILYRDTGWLLNVLNNGFLFLSGVFLPINSLQSPFNTISLMIPTSQAVYLIDDFSVKYLLVFSLINISYLLIGFSCFYLCEYKVKKSGRLGFH